MQTIHFDKGSNKELDRVCTIAFPSYNGNKIKVCYCENLSVNLASNWSGGSKDYYAIVRLSDGEIKHIGENFDNGKVNIPQGFVVVAHSIFCGKDMGLTVYVPQEGLFLPSNEVELTNDEKVVLVVTKGYVSSYRGRYFSLNGVRNLEQVKQTLVSKGLMTKQGAITTAGKNIVETSLRDFKLRIW